MVARLHALTVLASDRERLATFWGDLLGWERAGPELLPDGDHVVLADPEGNELVLRSDTL